MVGSMRLFGPSEWALRLPSAVAAIATLAIVTGFTWRLTRPTSTALLACIFLVTSRDFFGNHAAATGDYDALLCLFTTAYVCVLFFALHRRRPNPWAILSAGALVAAAVLTKGIAGLFPGLGIVIYLVATRRWFRLFTSPWYLVSGCAAALVTAGYYGLRELAAPGFLAAVMHNELGDRYFRTIGAHIGSPWTYLLLICKGHFSVGPLALLAPFGLAARPSRSWLGLLYSLCIAGSLLILLSLGATKLEWYILPAYPFLARRRAEAAGALADSSAPMTRPELRCWCSC